LKKSGVAGGVAFLRREKKGHRRFISKRRRREGEAPKARNMTARGSAEGAQYDSQQAPKARRASAEGAQYDSQGQVRSEAKHVAPGVTTHSRLSTESAKYLTPVFRTFSARFKFFL